MIMVRVTDEGSDDDDGDDGDDGRDGAGGESTTRLAVSQDGSDDQV